MMMRRQACATRWRSQAMTCCVQGLAIEHAAYGGVRKSMRDIRIPPQSLTRRLLPQPMRLLALPFTSDTEEETKSPGAMTARRLRHAGPRRGQCRVVDTKGNARNETRLLS